MRARPGLPDPVRRVANAAGILDVRADELAVARLEEAVGENARLVEPLSAVIEQLEQSLVPLLERVVSEAER
ncbi:MAG TPA: hypothetical protein VN088_10035 [Nocardioides sp.]|nr:hypothetical protein [Nocardioides sp.]